MQTEKDQKSGQASNIPTIAARASAICDADLRRLPESDLLEIGRELLEYGGSENKRFLDEYRRRREAFDFVCRGKRYEKCSFDSFDGGSDVVAKLKNYAATCWDNYDNGRGVVLYGPSGTGKDHLLTAMARECARRGLITLWANADDIHQAVRDSFDLEHVNETTIVSKFIRADVLYISDPIPASGVITEFQRSLLFRIIDGRYNDMKPTWVSVNVSSRTEFNTGLGVATADRLVDSAFTLFCNWKSHRSSINEKLHSPDEKLEG